MKRTFAHTLGFLLTVALAVPAPVAAQIKAGRKGGIEATRAQKTAELPTCSQPIGTLALSEPDNRWWVDLELGSPEACCGSMPRSLAASSW